MRKYCILLLCLLTLSVSAKKKVTVFTIGDSTMADKDISKGSPERGWGMVLQGCFSEDIIVDNHAKNGRSSISFINEGLWQKVLDKIQPGDYVFIQFGHNDEKHDQPGKNPRFAKPGSSFDANLTRYVNETRAKGGIPVLFNCVERRLFFDKTRATDTTTAINEAKDDESLRDVKYSEEKVNTEYLVPTHYTVDGDYTAAPYLVAKKLNVPFVDANRVSHWMEQEAGVVGSRKLHMWLKPGEVASIPDGRKDNTHYSIYGAHVISNLLADAIGDAVPDLKPYIRHYDYVVSQEGRGNYMTLEDAVKAATSATVTSVSSEGKVSSSEGKTTILVLDGTYTKPSLPSNIKLEVRSKAKLQ